MTDPHPTARARYGGVKIGSAFLGFAAASGVTAMLTGLATTAAVGIGLPASPPALVSDSFSRVTLGVGTTPQVIGYAVGLLVAFLAYALGGYVAGRMARFDGARQGVAVWVWGLVIGAVTLALTASVYGGPGVLTGVAGAMTPTALVALLVVLGVELVGAVLGGLAGMRFHRRVDRAETAPTGSVPSGA